MTRRRFYRQSCLVAKAAAVALVAGMFAGSRPGSVQAAVITVVDNGSPSNRVDVLLLGDGYAQADLDAGVYDRHIADYIDSMFGAGSLLNDPFSRYANFFNVHKIDVVSLQSGADIPSQGLFVTTALDAAYDTNGVGRLLTVDAGKANAVRNAHLSDSGLTADMQLVVVNDDKYGGSGGSWAVFAGGNGAAHEIALHEIGHSFAGLADEYSDFDSPYTGSEPREPNATKNPSGDKWAAWLGFDDPRDASLDIGVFEGALRYPAGVYRPSVESKMRSLGRSFDAVAREAFIQKIYALVEPLDAWRDNSATVSGDPLWVDLIDPVVQAVEWFVDGTLVPETSGEMFDPFVQNLQAGIHVVSARVYDRALDHAFDGGMLDLVRRNFANLEQMVDWTLVVPPDPSPGDLNGDGAVNAADLQLWSINYGQNGSGLEFSGDGNRDGDINGDDFLLWQSDFNGMAATAVPEPPAVALALIVAALFATRRRRSRAQSAAN